MLVLEVLSYPTHKFPCQRRCIVHSSFTQENPDWTLSVSIFTNHHLSNQIHFYKIIIFLNQKADGQETKESVALRF